MSLIARIANRLAVSAFVPENVVFRDSDERPLSMSGQLRNSMMVVPHVRRLGGRMYARSPKNMVQSVERDRIKYNARREMFMWSSVGVEIVV